MDLHTLKRWATPAKPTARPQTPVTTKAPAPGEGGAEGAEGGAGVHPCWKGCSAEEIGAQTDADLDGFDTWMTEQRPEIRNAVLDLANAIAEPNTKARAVAEAALSGAGAAEESEDPSADGLSSGQVSVLTEQLESAIADQGFEAGSDDLRRATLRALAMARSPDLQTEEDEPEEEDDGELGGGAPPAKAPPAAAKPAPKGPPAAARPGAKPAAPPPAKKPGFGRGV